MPLVYEFSDQRPELVRDRQQRRLRFIYPFLEELAELDRLCPDLSIKRVERGGREEDGDDGFLGGGLVGVGREGGRRGTYVV